MSEHAITSLAILKVNWDEGRDYIGNFVPFVVEAIRAAPTPVVSVTDLQQSISTSFGLSIPQGALKTILKRAARGGFVKVRDKMYMRNEALVSKLDLSRKRADALRDHESLIQKLTDFCKTHYQVEWSKEKAEAALLTYLEEHSIPILTAAVDGQAIVLGAKAPQNSEFLVSAFIKHLYDADAQGFRFLETVVKGRILANVVLYPDLEGIKRKFANIDVYVDTTLVLRAIGLARPELQAPCRELLNLLYQQNARLCVFEHTVDEINGVLDAACRILKNPHKQPHGETIEYLLQAGYKASDVELIIARLPRTLSALRIKVRSKPAHTNPLGLDEARLETVLKDEVQYQRDEALRHDVDCLTAIHRLRKGRVERLIETCGAIFVTTNGPLTRAAIRFFREEYVGRTVPLCVLDHVLTTIAWLKEPSKAAELPRKQMLATCYAALNPSDALWRKYVAEIGRLQVSGEISDEDYILLRFSTESRSALMDLTLGKVEAVTEGTVEDILEKARAAARKGVESQLTTERKLRELADAKAERAQAQLSAEAAAQKERYRELASHWSRWAMRGVLCLSASLLFVAAASPFLGTNVLSGLSVVWRLVISLAAVGSAAFGLCNLIWGTSLKSAVRRCEVSLAGWIEGRLALFFSTPR